jgi:hypothetical protein
MLDERIVREHESFQDPALKAAIRGVQKPHTASPELREAIVKRLATVHGEPAAPIRFPVRRWFALAAAVLICIGGAWYFHWREEQDEHYEYAKNDALLDAMVDIHKAGAKGEADYTPLAAALANPAALSAEAQKKLNRTIPAPDLTKAGWTLDAASFCDVNKHLSVRFHFARGGQTITLLSMPAAAYADSAEGQQYELMEDGHPIAGYIKSGSLNCVVGDTTLSLQEATSLRDQVRGG